MFKIGDLVKWVEPNGNDTRYGFVEEVRQSLLQKRGILNNKCKQIDLWLEILSRQYTPRIIVCII